MRGGASVTTLAIRPRRRAFDLVESAATQREATAAGTDRPFTAYEAAAAEALAALARAMAPSLDEVREIAGRHGLSGSTANLLREPKLAALLADRFPFTPPDVAACRAFFESDVDAFRTPDLYEGREILIGGQVADRDWRAEAYSRAERIVAMLSYDRRVFKDLLIYSAAATRLRDGRIGPVPKGGWDSEVAAPFFSLKAGEVFPLPVPSSLGFHILMMDQVTPGRRRTFAEAEGDVARKLATMARIAAAERHLQGLLRKAGGGC